MITSPLVTVMIPTYNQSHWLRMAIDSALEQDYANLEVIVSDDASTDNTLQILKQYEHEDRIKIFTNRKNLGRVGNYKHTLENYASGEWVVNLDGDDYFTDPSFISSAIAQISKTENVVFVQAGHSVTGGDGNVLYDVLPLTQSDIEIVEGTAYFLNFHHFSHLGSLFNRQAAVAAGFYLHNILSADIECFLRLSLNGKVILMRKSVGAWVHHGNNESKRLSVESVEKNTIRFKGPYEYARASGKIPADLCDKWLRQRLDEYLLHYLTIYFTSPARIPGYLAHALRTYPHLKTSSILPKALLKGMIHRLKQVSRAKKY